MKVKDLIEQLSRFKEDDIVVVEIHEGERNEDLYEFTIDDIEVKCTDGSSFNEVRLCI